MIAGLVDTFGLRGGVRRNIRAFDHRLANQVGGSNANRRYGFGFQVMVNSRYSISAARKSLRSRPPRIGLAAAAAFDDEQIRRWCSPSYGGRSYVAIAAN